MSPSKINEISHMISNIGKRQLEYYQFFPEYSHQLVKHLGEYLGDTTSVRLAPPTGGFDFLTTYSATQSDGQKLVEGKYQIGVMVKFDNLNDSGYTTFRLSLSCTKHKNILSISINKIHSIKLKEDEFKPLSEKMYKEIKDAFSLDSWFDEDSPNYQQTDIGFKLR